MSTAQRFQRLELKYHITEPMAEAIRRVIEPWCVPDAHNGEQGYPISSLYLDSPTLAFHRARLRGDADRVKLRIRTYGPRSLAHLEIKRKTGKIIHKIRTSLPRERVVETMGGFGVEDPTVDHFLSVRFRCGAEPKLSVFYKREAYTSTVDFYARVTFDRRIQARASMPSDWTLRSEPSGEGWLPLDGAGHLRDGVSSSVLLEFKCESFMPLWMSDVIRRFSLNTTGFSKYSQGVEVCGLGVSQARPVWRF